MLQVSPREGVMSSHEWVICLVRSSQRKKSANGVDQQGVERYRSAIGNLEMRSYTKTLRSAALTGLAMLAAVAITIHIVLTFFFMHGLLLTMCFLAALILIMPRIGRWHSKRQLHSSTN
jgi:hypothetical protein